MRVVQVMLACALALGVVPADLARADAVGVDHPIPTPEAYYVPITPCRVFDTSVVGGKMAANTTRNFKVIGSSSLVTQGGPKAGCGVPASATAVALNLTATGTAAAGYFQAFPYQTARPITKTLYYPANNTALAAAIIAVNKDYITLFTSQATHAIGEVTGYYVQQIGGLIYTGETTYIYSGNSRLVSVHYISTGLVDVTFDRDVTYCTMVASPYYASGYFVSVQPVGSAVARVRTMILDSNTNLAVETNTFVWLAVHC